jgi:hypothetical protein
MQYEIVPSLHTQARTSSGSAKPVWRPFGPHGRGLLTLHLTHLFVTGSSSSVDEGR